MALETLAEVIVALKRKTNYGAVSTTNDQMTLDIIKFINDRRDQIARAWNWDWLGDDLEITLQSGISEYTLDATVAQVEVLGGANMAPLTRITKKEYFKWYYNGELSHKSGFYYYSGRNAATGARKIKVGNLGNGVSTLVGYGKNRMAKFTVDDIAAGSNLLPLPDDMVGILKRLVEADIKNTQKNPEWATVEQLAKEDLERATAEEISDPGEEPRSPSPDTYRRRKAYRRYGRTA